MLSPVNFFYILLDHLSKHIGNNWHVNWFIFTLSLGRNYQWVKLTTHIVLANWILLFSSFRKKLFYTKRAIVYYYYLNFYPRIKSASVESTRCGWLRKHFNFFFKFDAVSLFGYVTEFVEIKEAQNIRLRKIKKN